MWLMLSLGLMVFVIFITYLVAVETCNEKFYVGLSLIVFSMAFGCALQEASWKGECEHNLPRNQECKIIAVPKEVIEK